MTAPRPPAEPPRGPNGSPGPGKPHIPAEGMPDGPPFRLEHLQELATPNHAGEIIFLASGRDGWLHPVRLILAASPRTGEIMRAAVLLRPGTGYVSADPACVPGNLRDICATLALEAGAELSKNR